MQKWEYLARISGWGVSLDGVLRQLGDNGWELVAVFPESIKEFKDGRLVKDKSGQPVTSERLAMFFKRPKTNPEQK